MYVCVRVCVNVCVLEVVALFLYMADFGRGSILYYYYVG